MPRLLDHSDFATVPLAMAATCACRPLLTASAIVLAALGVLAWTFIEYWAHRALHMKRFPRLRAIHMAHHQHPTEATGGTLYSSMIILALIVAAIALPSMAPAILGLFAGYLAFIVLHHAEHHGWPLRGGPLRGLADAHDLHHHAGPNRAFGVSTTLWDRLFGTA